MEIEQLRKELNHLLKNIVNHSEGLSDGRQIPSLEIRAVLAKVNKMQEKLIVLRHLLEVEEQNKRSRKIKEEIPKKVIKEEVIEIETVLEVLEEPITDVVEEKEEIIVEPIKEIPITTSETERANSVADQIQQAPIDKLVDAFTLNDRYLYANDLFNKDMSAFNEVIKKIDNCNSIEDAQTLFNQEGSKYNWDVENQLAIDFMGLIERRFI